MADEQILRIYIETPSGDRFEADIPCLAKVGQVAGDFFEAQGWPTADRRGRGQKAVVELVDPGNPDNTRRLGSDKGICESGLRNGDTLRIIPESLAGGVDYNDRLKALILDYNEMQLLAQQNPQITFTTNRSQAPDLYELTLHYESFVEFVAENTMPRMAKQHRVEIILTSQYPRRAPIVTWQTPVFHPNINRSGTVCLGVLMERYLPGMGLTRLVRMLVEIIQWRNFDSSHSFNPDAARWSEDVENWPLIERIGGLPVQGPIKDYMEKLDPEAKHALIIFRQVSNY